VIAHLRSKRRTNPPEEWISTPGSYDPIIAAELFERAQAILEGRKRRFTRERMLHRLAALYEKYSVITLRLIRFDKDCPAPATYAVKFGGLGGAFQAMFADVLWRVRNGGRHEILGYLALPRLTPTSCASYARAQQGEDQPDRPHRAVSARVM
jgi:hypothetical protein